MDDEPISGHYMFSQHLAWGFIWINIPSALDRFMEIQKVKWCKSIRQTVIIYTKLHGFWRGMLRIFMLRGKKTTTRVAWSLTSLFACRSFLVVVINIPRVLLADSSLDFNSDATVSWVSAHFAASFVSLPPHLFMLPPHLFICLVYRNELDIVLSGVCSTIN